MGKVQNQEQFAKYSFSKEKFAPVGKDRILHDVKFDTKPVGYLKDAFIRFRKNKSSVVASIIIAILVLFSIFGPLVDTHNYASHYGTNTTTMYYDLLRPRLSFMYGTGIWDGSKSVETSKATYNMYRAMEIELKCKIIMSEPKIVEKVDEFGAKSTMYSYRIDTYRAIKPFSVTVVYDDYKKLQDYQDEKGIQLILPITDTLIGNNNLAVWYKSNQKGVAELDPQGNFVPSYKQNGTDDYTSKMRLDSDPYNKGHVSTAYRYAFRTGSAKDGYSYELRINPYEYFQYLFDFEPSFVFGTDDRGFDIFYRLSMGARFSFLLALAVSVINLTIGAIYGAIEGYYGGAIDMVMERISDILSGIPFTVVTVLFNLHLAKTVGVVEALLFAFVLTGWIGMASRVRMQFYRFKNQEYVYAARTLGASDFRIMFKHIFPNSLGTIITGSVLVIPGVIFSETSLSYLGIINLNSASVTSVGAMLSAGQECLTKAPHVILFPALFIALLEISFNLFGNGLRDAFNPTLRGSED